MSKIISMFTAIIIVLLLLPCICFAYTSDGQGYNEAWLDNIPAFKSSNRKWLGINYGHITSWSGCNGSWVAGAFFDDRYGSPTGCVFCSSSGVHDVPYGFPVNDGGNTGTNLLSSFRQAHPGYIPGCTSSGGYAIEWKGMPNPVDSMESFYLEQANIQLTQIMLYVLYFMLFILVMIIGAKYE